MIKAEAPSYSGMRMTIPAREALERMGNDVSVDGNGTGPGVPDGSMLPSTFVTHHQTYRVTLRRPPAGVVLCTIGRGAEQHRGLRLADEPEYPGEWSGDVIAWHDRGDWVPCPQCGGALVWYEAGYVPGYRLCTSGHHVQLSRDGHSAKLVRA